MAWSAWRLFAIINEQNKGVLVQIQMEALRSRLTANASGTDSEILTTEDHARTRLNESACLAASKVLGVADASSNVGPVGLLGSGGWRRSVKNNLEPSVGEHKSRETRKGGVDG